MDSLVIRLRQIVSYKHASHDQSSHGRRGGKGGGGGRADAVVGARATPSAGQMTMFDVFDKPTPTPAPAPSPAPKPNTSTVVRSDRGNTILTVGRNDFAPKPKPAAPVAEAPMKKPAPDRRVKGYSDMNDDERRLVDLEAQTGPYDSSERNREWATKRMLPQINGMYRNEATAKWEKSRLETRIATLPQDKQGIAQNAVYGIDAVTNNLGQKLADSPVIIRLRNPSTRRETIEGLEKDFKYEISGTSMFGNATREQGNRLGRTFDQAYEIAQSKALSRTMSQVETRNNPDSILMQAFEIRRQNAMVNAKMPLLHQRVLDIVLDQ